MHRFNRQSWITASLDDQQTRGTRRKLDIVFYSSISDETHTAFTITREQNEVSSGISKIISGMGYWASVR